jgi:hypothetical protein
MQSGVAAAAGLEGFLACFFMARQENRKYFL